MTRLNKILSNSGLCSRRAADVLIKSGVVTINSKIITELATRPAINDVIAVNGKIITTNLKVRLWVYYKPIGLITTNSDPLNRLTIFENLKDLPRVITIGRLDINSEGLLLLTNNGDLARKFELPASRIKRIYKVRAGGDVKKLKQYLSKSFSLKINNIIYNIDNFKLADSVGDIKFNNWFEISLFEGKNREIRKIFEHFGLQVSRLIRISYGPFDLGNLEPGNYLEQDYANFQEFLS